MLTSTMTKIYSQLLMRRLWDQKTSVDSSLVSLSAQRVCGLIITDHKYVRILVSTQTADIRPYPVDKPAEVIYDNTVSATKVTVDQRIQDAIDAAVEMNEGKVCVDDVEDERDEYH